MSARLQKNVEHPLEKSVRCRICGHHQIVRSRDIAWDDGKTVKMDIAPSATMCHDCADETDSFYNVFHYCPREMVESTYIPGVRE